MEAANQDCGGLLAARCPTHEHCGTSAVARSNAGAAGSPLISTGNVVRRFSEVMGAREPLGREHMAESAVSQTGSVSPLAPP
jgi:hypothetical protein